ncbi:acetyltransferase [Myxococcus xanthus]|uniref:Acetyltransferase n=1 Tax=Myxococcus xanthus TaxID=34 RepID=A0AAE6KU80_MYXXA|nr:alpha/beta fold hydrolase [Myxococcus xanthus]QDE69981.1 acetyltransferase [Myxococcus xanthus]QDE77260.1 acetyltransferase [Myxococcus xanthus]
MSERIIESGDIRLCTEHFGREGDAPVLMLMGAASSMLGWPDGLMEQLARTGHFVIRYDHRDTGRSSHGVPGATPYTLDDLASDAISVLDGYGIERAHLVGMSLGGLLCQMAALTYPERVRSLTLISAQIFSEPDFEDPGMDPAVLAHFQRAATLNWADEAEAIGFQVELSRLCVGRARRSFDEARVRARAVQDYRRALAPQCALNHAGLSGGLEWYGRTREIEAPLLVIHGSVDPVIDHAHGVALSRAVKGARLVTLQDAGHDLHPDDWETMTRAITAHTLAASPPHGAR